MNERKEIKIGFLADSHLCRQQYGRKARSRQIFRSLENAIRAAHGAGVEYILHSGDLLDSNNPGVDVAISQLLELQQLLEGLKMKFYVIRGNHDSCVPSWWSTFEYFACSEYGIHSAPPSFEIEGIKVWARDWSPENEIRKALADPAFEEHDIALFHGDLAQVVGYPTENAVDALEMISPEKMKEGRWPTLISIGHVHKSYTTTVGEDYGQGLCVLSPGSTDITTRSDDRENPFAFVVATYSVEEGKKPVREKIQFVEYHASQILRFTVNKEEEVEKAKDVLRNNVGTWNCDVGIVYFVNYAPEVKDCVPKLQAFIDAKEWHEEVTLVTSSTEEVDLKALQVKDVHSAREIKTSPGKYFADHVKEYVKSNDPDLISLCHALLDPAEDGRGKLNEYVESKLGETIV